MLKNIKNYAKSWGFGQELEEFIYSQKEEACGSEIQDLEDNKPQTIKVSKPKKSELHYFLEDYGNRSEREAEKAAEAEAVAEAAAEAEAERRAAVERRATEAERRAKAEAVAEVGWTTKLNDDASNSFWESAEYISEGESVDVDTPEEKEG